MIRSDKFIYIVGHWLQLHLGGITKVSSFPGNSIIRSRRTSETETVKEMEEQSQELKTCS